jgi:hypothetical protein
LKTKKIEKVKAEAKNLIVNADVKIGGFSLSVLGDRDKEHKAIKLA